MRKNEKKIKAYPFVLKAKKLKRTKSSFSPDLNSPLTACLGGGVSFTLRTSILHIQDVFEGV